MQTDKAQKIFYSSPIDAKDDLEEKLEKARGSLQRLVGNGSERETHDALHKAACRDKSTHDDISLGLLANILTDSAPGASKWFRDLNFISRDSLLVVVENLCLIGSDKYHKLTDNSRSQLIWIIRELMKGSVGGTDSLCWHMMRQIAGGDISNRNLWLAENMLEIYTDNRSWLEKYPALIGSVIFTYLRILEDHFPPHLADMKQKEVNFVVSLIREHFNTVCMSPNLGMGRDFVRLLQGVSRIPEIQQLWNDIYFNPKTLSPHLTGLTQLLTVRTSRKYLQSRLTPEMEKKIAFLTNAVRFGSHKRYQEWFQRQFLATQESQTLRADIIRFIVGVIHPPNEILCSDILPRWAVIGWLLTTCTNPVAAANAKLALFFDWLVFDPVKDNIMNIEPGILVMYHSLRPHLAITATLLDFLIRLIKEFWPQGSIKIKEGVGAAFRTILDKKVLQSLEPVLEHPRLEQDLRNSIHEHLIPLLDTNTDNDDNPSISNNGQDVQVKMEASNLGLNRSYGSSSKTTSVDIMTNSYVPRSDPEFSDEDDEDEVGDNDKDEDDDAPPIVPSMAMRGSPTLTSATNAEDAERSKIFELVQPLYTHIRMPLEELLNESNADKSDPLEEIFELANDQPFYKEAREALCKVFSYVFKADLSAPCVDTETNLLVENLSITPIAEILDSLLRITPQEAKNSTARPKNMYRILNDLITDNPSIAYKVLLILGQLSENPDSPACRDDSYGYIYKHLATTHRGLKFEQALNQDLKMCFETEPIAIGFLCPFIYVWFPNETVGSSEILKLVVSTIDSSQLQDIVWRIAQGDIILIESGDVISIINKTLEWETWEQHCVWTIMAAHQFETEDYLPIIPTLDFRANAEALTALFLLLKNERPSDKVLGPCLCRKPNSNDRFVLSLLMSWSEDHKEILAEVLTSLLVRAYGSPVKRKRGGNMAGRGTASPAGPATPNVDNVLAHLDLLRNHLQASGDLGIFSTDTMQAALLQVQSWVTDPQRNKYKDLLAMAAEEEASDTKDIRSSSKRVVAGKKLPSSPTGSGGGPSGSNLSRTRSGRTRTQTIKNDSETSSEEEDDILPRPRNAKKRRKTSALNSDSD